MLDWFIGALGSLLIASLAYRRRSLSASGAIGAFAIGTVLYALGSLYWFGLMIAFFCSSTFLTKWKKTRKKEAEDLYQKTGTRDLGQVIANGGAGFLCCIGNEVYPHPAWSFAFAGVMAAVTADTWATEIGGLSSKPPRLILTGKTVRPGTSGGVTALGLGAAAAGGLFIGVAGLVFLLITNYKTSIRIHSAVTAVYFVIGITIGGILGAVLDSVIGAKWQQIYRCPECGKEVEASRHCGFITKPIRGISWMDNDAVNVICSLAGGLCAVLILNSI